MKIVFSWKHLPNIMVNSSEPNKNHIIKSKIHISKSKIHISKSKIHIIKQPKPEVNLKRCLSLLKLYKGLLYLLAKYIIWSAKTLVKFWICYYVFCRNLVLNIPTWYISSKTDIITKQSNYLKWIWSAAFLNWSCVIV